MACAPMALAWSFWHDRNWRNPTLHGINLKVRKGRNPKFKLIATGEVLERGMEM
jgi:hypothetical protein